ncbi:MAG: MBL fold metallo-hydrolase [Acidobacteriota bacterium]
MTRLLVPTFLLAMAVVSAACAPEPPLTQASREMGAAGLTTIRFVASGSHFVVGQPFSGDAAWPRFNLKSLVVEADYAQAALRHEMTRTQGENPPRGGGGQPLAGEQRQVLVVAGAAAWNVGADNAIAPQPAAVVERTLQLWSTPHGFLKGAEANAATVTPREGGGHSVSYQVMEKYTLTGTLGATGLVEQVETAVENPVLGDMPIVTTYSDYRDHGGVKFPARIVQTQGGMPVFDMTVSEVTPNAPVTFDVPAEAEGATAPAVKVDVTKNAEGVYYLTGGSHHSVLVEFSDHVVVVEGPQHDQRAVGVIDAVKATVPGKPIRYLVNTHHHFDHSGGVRAFVAEGATIVTHESLRTFYERAWAVPRTLAPDAMAKSGRTATFETVGDKHVLTDGKRTLELHHIKGNAHNDGMLMAYLPRERILVQADAFNPPPPNAPPPATPNPFSVNLWENLQALKLNVTTILPIHGRAVTPKDLAIAIGKATG